MFPSSGFFKGIICPYLASGLCERPYCHYRHTGLKPEDKKPMGLIAGSDSSMSNIAQQLTTYESSALVKITDTSTSEASQAPSRHMPSMLNMVGSALSRVQTRGVNDKAVCYRPTPKAATKFVAATATNPANQLKSAIPKYTPTPIHLLKQSRSKVDDLEYDPISNYSTNIRPLGNVRVTLADAERETLKRPLEKADSEASVAKRPKIANVSVEDEAQFSEEEEEESVKKGKTVPDAMAKKKLGDGKISSSSGLENSSAFKAEGEAIIKIQGDLTLMSSDDPENANFSVSPKAKSVAVKDRKEEQTEDKMQTVTKEMSQNCEMSTEKKGDENSQAGISDSSTRNSDTNDKQVKKKDKIKEKSNVESDKHRSNSRDRESGNKRDHNSSGKNAETLEMVNKENKIQSTLKDVEGSSANRHRHNHHRDRHHHHHHSSKDHGKTLSKEENEHLREPKQHGKEHSKHSEGHKKLSNREHNSKEHRGNLQQTVNLSEGSDLPKEQQHGKSSSDEKSVHNNSHSSSIHRIPSVSNTGKEKGEKPDSKNRLAREPCAHNRGKDTKKKDVSLIELEQKKLMRSMSEYTKNVEASAEKDTRRGSLEENDKKLRIDHTDPKVFSSHEAFESSCLRSEKTSDFPKSNAANRLPSSSLRRQHRTLSNSSSSSNKTISTSLGTSKAMKRTISQLELFGEDSDTELDLNKKQYIPMLGSGDGQFHPEKQSRTLHDAEDDESDVSYCDVIDELLDESENPSGSRFEECHRLFLEARGNEGRGVATRPTAVKEAKVQNVEDPSHLGKKRLAHTPLNDTMEIKRILPEPKRIKPNAANVMLNRYLELQKAAANDKVPLSKEQEVQNSIASAVAGGCVSTTSTASLKIKLRVAHVPKSGDFLKKPILTIVGSSKIPVNVRQTCLDKIYQECSNIYDEAQDAKERALAEEKAIYEKSATKSIYLNLVSNTVRRLRDESPLNKTLSPKNPNAMSHEAILGGSKAANTSFTVNRWGKPPPIPDNFSSAELYKRLLVYLMSETQLVENSYPHPNPDNPEEVVIRKSERDLQKPQTSDPNQKFCCRCGKAFVILPTGAFAREEECLYHWGHAWKQRVGGTFDNIYNCCGGDLSSRGCQMSKCHVHDDNRYRCLTGYMTTMPSSPRRNGDYGVYALDCEMVYTTFGCELARITVIGPNLELVLDKIVKPDHEVIDYNTRFSGLTADDLRNVTTNIRDVQAILLHMFNSKTILIGHSLESDLIALKLVHNTVVDTAIVFPHRRGLPFKRALQNVVKETLQKIIQNNISGHDSSEDARSCMELMLWKVKEDAKRSLRFA